MPRKGQRKRVTSASSSLGSNLSKKRNALTYVEKEEALKLMNEGKATPQIASRYGCGARQFQKLKHNGLPISKRNRDPD